jgi:rhodanese-related sulfurtransferase
MSFILAAILVAALCLLIAIWLRRARNQSELHLHSISPEALHTLLDSKQQILLFDVRQPLDLLADPEIIKGAARIPLRDLIENPSLIPSEKDAVVYCTCPDDKTSRLILRRAQRMHLTRIRFLKGGLAGWKAKGYPVERYEEPFHLDTRT